MKIAVVGAGIAGIGAAWLLSPDNTVDIYESETRLGGHAYTIDLTVELPNATLKSFSVRGTVTEGVQTVSRIDEFDRLYFEPSGMTLFCVYDDRPGVIATISRKLADAGINIEDMRNPHDTKTNRSLAIVKVNTCVGEALLAEISKEISAHAAVCTEV